MCVVWCDLIQKLLIRDLFGESEFYNVERRGKLPYQKSNIYSEKVPFLHSRVINRKISLVLDRFSLSLKLNFTLHLDIPIEILVR
jgi:hypothetical protein